MKTIIVTLLVVATSLQLAAGVGALGVARPRTLGTRIPKGLSAWPGLGEFLEIKGTCGGCDWKCDKPNCPPPICTPKCKDPKCEVKCQDPDAPKCDTICGPPVCENKCEKDAAEKAAHCTGDLNCPPCKPVCKPPECKVKCEDPQPKCETYCEDSDCDWDCKKPQCPEPACRLECSNPVCKKQKCCACAEHKAAEDAAAEKDAEKSSPAYLAMLQLRLETSATKCCSGGC